MLIINSGWCSFFYPILIYLFLFLSGFGLMAFLRGIWSVKKLKYNIQQVAFWTMYDYLVASVSRIRSEFYWIRIYFQTFHVLSWLDSLFFLF